MDLQAEFRSDEVSILVQCRLREPECLVTGRRALHEGGVGYLQGAARVQDAHEADELAPGDITQVRRYRPVGAAAAFRGPPDVQPRPHLRTTAGHDAPLGRLREFADPLWLNHRSPIVTSPIVDDACRRYD